jgi:Lrp/AsnC family transcriptional regulator, regulator of ectoine-degradation genes
VKLDKFDLRILEALQADGRLPAVRLAEQVGLSSSPTWERIRKLEEAGIVRGYHADLAVERLTSLTTIIVPVALENHRAHDFQRFEQAIEKIPEIVECWAVGGGVDYVLRFAAPSIEAYQAMFEQLLRADLGIQRYWSYIVTKPIKPFTGIPVMRLLGGEEQSAPPA